MREMHPVDLAAAAGATLVCGEEGGAGPRGASVDTRTVGPGDLFFGLRGERVDGGAFASEALDRGAWGVCVGEAWAGEVAGALPGSRVLQAADPHAALVQLARSWRLRLGGGRCRAVGITGSTGKTSVKDIALAMLGPAARVHANRSNLNTEFGLPLTILEAPPDTEILLLEMAMRGPGQIRELASIGMPEVGVITNVGPVHLELLGSVEAVARAKAELVAALPSGGTCVLPAVEPLLFPYLRGDLETVAFADEAAAGPPARTGPGSGPVPRVKLVSAEPGLGCGRATLEVDGDRIEFELNVGQRHNLMNATIAVAIGVALGIAPRELREGAREVSLSGMRGQEIDLAAGGVLIDDCYNANPVAMRAALDHLALAAGGARRRVAVLGDMLELGPRAAEFHRSVGREAAERRVDLLIGVGDLAAGYAEGFAAGADGRGECRTVRDSREAADLAARLVADGDAVLVKGSRAVGLEAVARRLAADGSVEGDVGNGRSHG